MQKPTKANPLILNMLLVVLIISMLLITGCQKVDDKEINQNILNTVVEIEKNNYELNTLAITYDQYKEKTNKYLSKYFTSFYDSALIIYADGMFKNDRYKEEHLKGMSLDEIKKIGEPLSRALAEQHPIYFYTSYDASKVYDDNSSSDTSMHYKHIFTKHTIKEISEDYAFYKQYSFKKEGNDYVLFQVKNIFLEQVGDQRKELTYGNETVEFIENKQLVQ